MAEQNRFTNNPVNSILRSKYARDDGWIRDFLGRARIGHVATQSGNQPYITPVTFWYDPGKHEIYFHTNIVGRLRANSERNARVCFEASKAGKALPSNVALNFNIQYESVVAFGNIRIVEDEVEMRRILYGLIDKYFPGMKPGEHYRPITPNELRVTTVFAISIDSWSGKRNWKHEAEEEEDWPKLEDQWFQ